MTDTGGMSADHNDLCDTCKTVRFDVLPSLTSLNYNSPEKSWAVEQALSRTWTVDQLKANIRECHFCDLILRAMDRATTTMSITWKDEEEITFRRRGVAMRQHEGKSLTMYAAGLWRNAQAPFVWLFPVQEYIEVTGRRIRSPVSGRKVTEQVDLTLLGGWLKTCREIHGADDGSRNALLQPRRKFCFRLIDVMRQCVVEEAISTDFVALSYVWGDSRPIKLDKGSYQQLSEPGSLSKLDLPLVFHDAMKVVQNLGFAYIWIDCLCIVQDDPEDFRAQINNMDSIYSAAYATIVSCMPNANEGLPGMSASRLSQVTGRYKDLELTAYFQNDVLTYKGLNPWSSRGWCLQERFFSQRMFLFTPHKVFFRCAAETHFEDVDHMNYLKFYNMVSEEYLSQAGHLDANNTKSIVKQFRQLAIEYSRRLLSQDSDITKAYLGILTHASPLLGKHYWCVPKYMLLYFMHWSHEHHRPESRRVEVPSWSWLGWKSSFNHTLNLFVQPDQRIKWLLARVYTFDSETEQFQLVDKQVTFIDEKQELST